MGNGLLLEIFCIFILLQDFSYNFSSDNWASQVLLRICM